MIIIYYEYKKSFYFTFEKSVSVIWYFSVGHFGNWLLTFWELKFWKVDILRVDILTVDILGVEIVLIVDWTCELISNKVKDKNIMDY